MNFAFINRRKKELGLTNEDISQKTGITVSTLDKITAGKNGNPKLDTLQAIARALHCSLDNFDDEPKKKLSEYNQNEMTLISNYRVLPTPEQHVLLGVSAVMVNEYSRAYTRSNARPGHVMPLLDEVNDSEEDAAFTTRKSIEEINERNDPDDPA